MYKYYYTPNVPTTKSSQSIQKHKLCRLNCLGWLLHSRSWASSELLQDSNPKITLYIESTYSATLESKAMISHQSSVLLKKQARTGKKESLLNKSNSANG